MDTKRSMLATMVLLTLSSIIVLGCIVGCRTHDEGQPLPTDSPATSTSQGGMPDYQITIMGHEGVEICITDPEGRHLGIDPLSREMINEIPDADFQDNPTWGHDASRGDSTAEPAKLVTANIPNPIEGLYRVQAHGTLEPLVMGGLSLSARHSGEVKARRGLVIESDQELPAEYEFTYSLDNEELVTELSLVEE